jgi:hypothetical protein
MRLRPSTTLMTALLLIAAGVLSGCRNADGTTTYPVIGLGFVTVPDSVSARPSERGVAVTGFTAGGVFCSTAPPIAGLLVGGLRWQSVEVGPRADVLVEAVQGPDGRSWYRVQRVLPAGQAVENAGPAGAAWFLDAPPPIDLSSHPSERLVVPPDSAAPPNP